MLDLAIESSDLGIDINNDENNDEDNEQPRGQATITNLSTTSTMSLPLSATETPIARRFRGSSTPPPSGSPEPIADTPMQQHHSNASTTSFSSYHRLSFEDRQDDWSRSVLTAAHASE
jgi:hypothetical protein